MAKVVLGAAPDNLRTLMAAIDTSAQRAESALCALHRCRAFAVSLATVVAVCPEADLMPVAIASEVAGEGWRERPGLPASRSCRGPVSVRLR